MSIKMELIKGQNRKKLAAKIETKLDEIGSDKIVRVILSESGKLSGNGGLLERKIAYIFYTTKAFKRNKGSVVMTELKGQRRTKLMENVATELSSIGAENIVDIVISESGKLSGDGGMFESTRVYIYHVG